MPTDRRLRPGSALALIVLASIHPVAAHGAPPAREIDIQVLLDDDGLLEYGGCAEDQCAPTGATGLDLLALDARNAALPDGTPCVVFRVTFQTDAPQASDRKVRITFLAGGQPRTVDIVDPDYATPRVEGGDRVGGPEPVGDGHPLAVDAWVAYGRIGATQGDTISDVRVLSMTGDGRDDDMPGTWYSNGMEVPHLPHEADPGEAVEEHPPGTFLLGGPDRLLDVGLPPAPFLTGGDLTVTVRNPLTNLSQAVETRLTTEGLGRYSAGPDAFVLGPGQSANVTLTASEAGAADLILRVSSDLGAWESIGVRSLPLAANTTSSSSAPAQEKGSPGLGLPAVAATLALAMVLVRARLRRA